MRFFYENIRRTLMENLEEKSSTMIIGDSIAYYLQQNLNTENTDLISSPETSDFTLKTLTRELQKEDIKPNVENLIVSIGSHEFFSNSNLIVSFCDMIYEIFPNAEYYVVEGFLPPDVALEINDDERKELSTQRFLFYKEFSKNGFFVVKSGDVFSIEETEQNSTQILKVVNELNTLIDLTPEYIDKVDDKKQSTNISTNKNDDSTDFDTIYEFLHRFEKLTKSNNVYTIKNQNSKYDPDVHQIEIALMFLLPDLVDEFSSDGIYDNETKDAVATFQSLNGLEVTGIADPETLEEMFYDLKIESFNEEDLAMFIQNKRIVKKIKKGPLLNGKVKITGLSGQQAANAQLMIDYMYEKNIKNPYTQIGILCTIGKESGFVPQNEICYNTTSSSRIVEIFGNCRTNDVKLLSDWGLTLDEIKLDCEKFFDAMYGSKATGCIGWNTDNTEPGDGYKYRGRGFNGITFKHIYNVIGGYIGEDLVGDPDKLNDLNIAAKAAIAYFTDGRDGNSLPEFDNEEEAIDYFVDKNAGGRPTVETRSKAFEFLSKFEIIE